MQVWRHHTASCTILKEVLIGIEIRLQEESSHAQYTHRHCDVKR